MSDMTDDGGPAFPVNLGDFRDADSHPMVEMYLRDLFAVQLAAGLCFKPGSWEWDKLCAYAYVGADAMLEARKQKGTKNE